MGEAAEGERRGGGAAEGEGQGGGGGEDEEGGRKEEAVVVLEGVLEEANAVFEAKEARFEEETEDALLSCLSWRCRLLIC